MSRFVLDLLPDRLALCRLAPEAPLPPATEGSFWSVTRTPAELSLILPESAAPAAARVEPGYRALRVRGPLDLALTGVMAELAGALAEAGVALLAFSTFDTDWLLVREAELPSARLALESRGHLWQEASEQPGGPGSHGSPGSRGETR